jgi:hypothetical protein
MDVTPGCRGFFGPIPLPLWMSNIRLWSTRYGTSDRFGHLVRTLGEEF